MIACVSEDNQHLWAELCVSLWPDNTVESFLDERARGGYQNEFLYFVDGEAAGFVSLSLRHDYVEGTKSSPVGYLEGIYVKPEYRKQGISRKMVEYAKKWSAEQGCAEFASDCRIENEESRKFHNKIGFREANTIVCFTMRI